MNEINLAYKGEDFNSNEMILFPKSVSHIGNLLTSKL